jgi:hypothetical protein
MRQVTLIGGIFGMPVHDQINWLHQAAQQIAAASKENDIVQVSNNFLITGAYTPRRTIDVTAATLAELREFVSTLVDDFKKGGSTRTT